MKFDLSNYDQKYTSYLGVDEVGRGPLAGPVVTCSFMADNINSLSDFKISLKNLKNLGIMDSKKLSQKKRQKILSSMQIEVSTLGQSKSYICVIKNCTYSFSISILSNISIDRINILNASLESMSRSVNRILKEKTFTLVDGNKLPPKINGKVLLVIKGDQLSLLIGMASIIAKEWRDRYMLKLSKFYPEYNFECHNGYPTKLHRENILKYGICSIHRKTFNGCKR